MVFLKFFSKEGKKELSKAENMENGIKNDLEELKNILHEMLKFVEEESKFLDKAYELLRYSENLEHSIEEYSRRGMTIDPNAVKELLNKVKEDEKTIELIEKFDNKLVDLKKKLESNIYDMRKKLYTLQNILRVFYIRLRKYSKT